MTGVQWEEERGEMGITHKGVGKVESSEGRERKRKEKSVLPSGSKGTIYM